MEDFPTNNRDPGAREREPIVDTKERKRHDRFNGLTEEEVTQRTLPDHLTPNLDVVIVSFLLSFNILQGWCVDIKERNFFA